MVWLTALQETALRVDLSWFTRIHRLNQHRWIAAVAVFRVRGRLLVLYRWISICFTQCRWTSLLYRMCGYFFIRASALLVAKKQAQTGTTNDFNGF